MPVSHPAIANLLNCIDLEEKEQVKRYSLDQQHTLKSLKTEGLALHPITITRKGFGYADYPEITFRLPFPAEMNLFKDGAAIECFITGEEPVKGVLLQFAGTVGEFRLFAPDFPEWIEDAGVGIKLAPDQRTTSLMKNTLSKLEENKALFALFKQIHAVVPEAKSDLIAVPGHLNFYNSNLNDSQKAAVFAITENENFIIVHGPPGTGKTTTLIEAIKQLIARGQKVVVSAPSNAAVDHLAEGLISKAVKVLRVGNSSKVSAAIFSHTLEGKLNNSKEQKEIKQLMIRAEEFRKMAHKYKRSFGKAEREQRNLLFKEVKDIRAEIKKIRAYNEEKLYREADVILGTPVGLTDAKINGIKFQTLVMDEAGQCIEPLAWCVFPFAEKYVLAGDHFQLPPTVLSMEAAQKGLNKSILEACITTVPHIYLLNTQYRMRAAIAGFSGEYFYKSLLLTAPGLENLSQHIYFIDTAGSGFNETAGANGISLQNEGELSIVQKIITLENIVTATTAFISPYAGQVAAARERLPPEMRINTIDSFQGQEQHCVILSLVRSNDECDIGFLKDYRRMNVAITRAKEKLFVIGDSATIGADPFYNRFLQYIDQHGIYRSVWEFE